MSKYHSRLPTVEEVLLPLLELLSRKALTVQEACKVLAKEMALHEVEQREVESNFASARFNPRVTGAWQTLSRAGLLEDGPWRWAKVASSRGREILALGLRRLTVKEMEGRIPSYAALHQADELESVARGYRDRALENYASGRRLMSEGALLAAPVLLGYAIEMLLKAGLHRFRNRWGKKDKDLVSRSHDLAKLYARARELAKAHALNGGELFANTFIANDFLEFARDQFARRYRHGEKHLSGGRTLWSFGTTKLATYDDCLCQLDDSLAEAVGNPAISLVHAALHENNPLVKRLASEIFRENPFAHRSAANYLIEPRKGSRGFLATMKTDASRYDDFIAKTQQRQRIFSLNLAAWFCYPKDNEPDPDPLLARRSNLGLVRAFVDRLSSEFGEENVRVISAPISGSYLIVQVFDRSAKPFYREIRLKGERNDVLWVEREKVKQALEDAILNARRQFKTKRPNLLLPPAQA